MASQEKGEEVFREKTLKSFFRYGKLVKIPSQKKKRDWVLEKVAQSFSPKKTYSLKEALRILEEVYPDPNPLLNELHAAGYLVVKNGQVTSGAA